MPNNRLTTFAQESRDKSPWSLKHRLRTLLWSIAWLLLFRPTPRYCYKWRNFLLKCFGCKITGVPFSFNTARIKFPWLLTLEDHASIGDHAIIYNLGPVTLKARSLVAQEVYVCAGTHDLSDPRLPLQVAPIIIGEDVFIGVRALLLPGVEIGPGAVIGAGSVVTKDMPPWTICAGNPCKPLKPRPWPHPQAESIE